MLYTHGFNVWYNLYIHLLTYHKQISSVNVWANIPIPLILVVYYNWFTGGEFTKLFEFARG